MAIRTIFFTLCFFMLNNFSFAQQSATYTNELVDYQKALTLYNNKQYQAAQSLFENIKEDAPNKTLESDCAYYIANCAVRLNQQNADALIEDFVNDYPTSTKRNTAFLDVADYYFANGKYAYARKWYDKVDENSIARSERDRFNFNYGYSLYATKDETAAQKYLNRVTTSTEYGSQAKYYIGFMAYEGDDYEKANTYFDQVSDQEKYKEKLSYYQADLNFKLGKFEEAIQLAKAQTVKGSPQEKSELSKIIGESYFNLQKYDEAIPYLKEYKGKKGKWNNTDYYQLGYAYYKQNDFEKAISEFNKIIGGDNSVAQNAYYHLGESYINLNKKQEALNAFRNASQMDYDLKIQEDAYLNYAKISYEIGNPYQSVPQVLTSYLTKYPNTQFKDEVETLLIDSYITSKNYKEALKLLENKNSFENRVAFQKVAFFRGIELYNEGDYNEARSFFEKAMKEAKTPIFTTRATFWKAETDFILSNFNDALIGFKQFAQNGEASEAEEFKNLDYNLGYTYFKLKNYSKSVTHFQSFVNSKTKDQLRLNDAYLRLADGHFVSSDYKDAIKAYEKAIALNKVEADYATFQKAVSYGFTGEGDTKMKELNAFIHNFPKSALRDDAMYELANSYIKTNQNDKALALYDRLNAEYPSSVFVSKALLRQGLSFYNSNDNEKALTKFKKVASDFPNTEDANQAVSTARLIYIDLGRVDEYATWVKTLDFVNVSDSELDNTAYLAAEKQYLDDNTDAAIKQFNKYINEFPNGIHATKSHFYLAELYNKKQLPENAKPHYEAVVKASRGEFTEQAIVKLSNIYLNKSEWKNAIALLKRLETEADYPQNVTYAQSNLMNAYYQLNDYNQAVTYAEKALQNSKIDNKVKSDAQIIIARSAIKTNNPSKAKDAYAKVEKIATGALAAEALYYNAYFKNKEADFEASNTAVQKLAKDYSSYKYYSAKGLVLMAKNFYALKDAFQATYILESVISNFTEFEEVVTEAQQELSKIKTEEAKTNASVQTEND
ncbi:tetratricopeptide repeat protein [Subsaximicrobium wynnwilliamsii]|uniref:Tetratricopeptide repeat protein n=1 Tax=Subsaximicrobium wynnwilliamsii TaxID=291179 RepID=A0A5C6ZHD8_9FLAO|nr:tetratricopeptide repeat protein [Subsaximicrobium wynnwilliamsii]TXD83337.1 tetratricopeptide repeat protein [Subsaximicrobium wynnwilliamsii]TXD89126.1 tetratricopeptide repeat protein [Subsaximicrobium wynnwilliamsii]TXE03361.1 tetratricopeptide repeat protein [Subsaximicrobium wynnwilliamsii]